ncbi:MAG: hypothetical protein IJY91_03690 [Oscillospiraceae bacterium]|nr:hypothetical protein [Oscillospiraceae bacterium]
MRGNEFLDKMELIDPAYIEAADAKPKKKKNVWGKWGSLAACFCLIVATAIAVPGLLPGDKPEPDPKPGNTIDQANIPDVYPSVDIVPGSVLNGSQDTCVFHYNEASTVLDAARRYIPGYFTEELNSEELAAIIPDRQAAEMTFSGYAGFDGEGTLIDVVLQVDAPFLDNASVSVLFSNDEPIRCCVIPDEPVTSKLNGCDFEIYKWSSNSETFYYDAIGRINGCSVQISYMSSGSDEGQSRIDFEVLADCFTAYKDGKPNLSAIKADAIPEFFDVKLTLSEAQADADFGAYMLGTVPSGYTEESIRRYKDQNKDYLSGLWTNGLADLSWNISAYNENDSARLTSVVQTENYDLSLYPIPRADSVPEELREIVDNPIFDANELTLEAVYMRAYKVDEAGDIDGWRMAFSVKYGDIIVEVRTKGVEPEWVYQQLMNLLEK